MLFLYWANAVFGYVLAVSGYVYASGYHNWVKKLKADYETLSHNFSATDARAYKARLALEGANADAAKWRNAAVDARQAYDLALKDIEKLTQIKNKHAAKRREYRKAKARK